MRNLILGLGAVLMALASCQKEDDLPEAARLFRPVAKEGLVSEGNWVSASFQQITGATSYTLQISRDTFQTIDATITTDTSYAVFEELAWSQLYQVQVRANAPDSVKNSKFSNLGSIKTPKFPTILITPTIDDVSDEAVKVRWTTGGAEVTSLKVLKASDSSLVKEVTLTTDNVSDQYRIVNGLSGNTEYIVYLYSGTTVRGWDNYKTKEPLSGTIIDLRSIEDRPSVLADTLPLIPNGATVILKRGMTYNIASAVNLSQSVTILSGSDLQVPDAATIYFTSNFNFLTGSNIDYIEFKNVKLVGSDWGGKYVINANNSTSAAISVGRLSFESCQAEIFRGIVRLQGSNPIKVNNLVFNNCIIDSVKDYGVAFVNAANNKFDNITISNSTIYKAEKVITHTSSAFTSLSINNCTINDAPMNGNSFIDCGSIIVSNGITISNCIFGIGRAKGTPPLTTYKGAVYGTGTNIDASGNFKTSDMSFASNAFTVADYSKPSTDLWQSPATGDFKIKDNSFAGKSTAGDPRWR